MADKHYEWLATVTVDHRVKDQIQYNPQRCDIHPVNKGAAPLAFWTVAVAGIPLSWFVCSDCVEDLLSTRGSEGARVREEAYRKGYTDADNGKDEDKAYIRGGA